MTHLGTKYYYPSFTPPATLDKPLWIRVGLYGELCFHIGVLGAMIVGIRNRIPFLRTPSYSDDGTVGIGVESAYERIHWGHIFKIVVQFALYLGVWAWVYGII